MKFLSLFILLFFFCEFDRCWGYRILGIFPLKVKSHFIMFERLMKGLAIRGHQVDVISNYPLVTPVLNYTDIILQGFYENPVNNMTHKESVMYGGTAHFEMAGEKLGNFYCKTVLVDDQVKNIIKNPPKEQPYDLVVMEVFYANCFAAFGHHLDVPLIGVSTSFWPWISDMIGNPESLAISSNVYLGFGHAQMNFWERTYNVLFTFYTNLLYHHVTSPQNEIIKKMFGPNIPELKDLEKSFALLLVNSHQSLNDPLPKVPSLIEVGGLHIQDDGSQISNDDKEWIDRSTDGFIYFSFGSMMLFESMSNNTIHTFYKSFANIAPMRVLMKAPRANNLPPGLPENVRTFSWISQINVLKHKNIRAFITHGGLMSCQEAVTYGVPMIGIPLFADQFANVENVARRNIAVRLDYERLTEKNLDFALKEILYNPSYRVKAKELSIKFLDRPSSALDTACYWVEYIGRHGSKALRSPGFDFNWWQVQLLDVYIAILFYFFLSIAIFELTIRFLIKKIYCMRSKSFQACSKKSKY